MLITLYEEIPLTGLGILIYLWMTTSRLGLVNFEAVFWFYLGGILLTYESKGEKADNKYIIYISGLIFIILLGLLTFMAVNEVKFSYQKYLYEFNLFLGMIFLWKLVDIQCINNMVWKAFASVSYSIYLFHEPFLSLLQYYVCRKIIIESAMSQIIFFFVSAVFIFILIGIIGIMCQRLNYKLHSLKVR